MEITHNIENAKREKCNLQANRIRVSNMQKSLCDNPIFHNKQIQRIKLSKVIECLKCFNELPCNIREDFTDEIEIINKEIDENQTLLLKVEDLIKKFTKKIDDNTLDLENEAIKEYYEISKVY